VVVLVPAYPGCPGKEAVKWVVVVIAVVLCCVCMCMCTCVCVCTFSTAGFSADRGKSDVEGGGARSCYGHAVLS